ncbi:hypothetical protein CF319_g6691 [Tilletia indica]|nr:hypothetical protein CF319_g6691 [Tilletia indica]
MTITSTLGDMAWCSPSTTPALLRQFPTSSLLRHHHQPPLFDFSPPSALLRLHRPGLHPATIRPAFTGSPDHLPQAILNPPSTIDIVNFKTRSTSTPSALLRLHRQALKTAAAALDRIVRSVEYPRPSSQPWLWHRSTGSWATLEGGLEGRGSQFRWSSSANPWLPSSRHRDVKNELWIGGETVRRLPLAFLRVEPSRIFSLQHSPLAVTVTVSRSSVAGESKVVAGPWLLTSGHDFVVSGLWTRGVSACFHHHAGSPSRVSTFPLTLPHDTVMLGLSTVKGKVIAPYLDVRSAFADREAEGPLPPAVTTSLLARSSRPFPFRGADRGSVGGGPTLDQEGSMPRLWRSPTLASKFCRAPTLHELGRDWEGRRTKHFVISLLAFTLLVSAPVMAKAMVVVATGMGSPTCAPFHGRSHGRGSA